MNNVRHRHRVALAAFVLLSLAFSSCSRHPSLAVLPELPAKRFPVVLVHGLANKHAWSKEFLETCLDVWGSGRVFVVYTNTRPEDRKQSSERMLGSRRVIVGGVDSHQAGDRSIVDQARFLDEIVRELQAHRQLTPQFSIIAHSMGGLVSRSYIAAHPSTVADLVTLGTPHHGSPLAEHFEWAGHFVGARAAIHDLRPDNCALLNARHPAASAPLAAGGRIHTIRGDADGGDSFGALGELALGWSVLRAQHHTDNDGLVPSASALLQGALHLEDFPDYDHLDLVRRPDVAHRAARALR